MGLPAMDLNQIAGLPEAERIETWTRAIYNGNESWEEGIAIIPIRVRMQPYIEPASAPDGNLRDKFAIRFVVDAPNTSYLDQLANINQEARMVVRSRFPDRIQLTGGGNLWFWGVRDRIVIDPISLFALFMYMTPASIRPSPSRPQAANFGPAVSGRLRGFQLIQTIGISPLSQIPENEEGRSRLLNGLLTGVDKQASIIRNRINMVAPTAEPAARREFVATLAAFEANVDPAQAGFVAVARQELLDDWDDFWDDGSNYGIIARRLTEGPIRGPGFSQFGSLPPELRLKIFFLATGLDPDNHKIEVRARMRPRIDFNAVINLTSIKYDMEIFQPGVDINDYLDVKRVSQINAEARRAIQRRYPSNFGIGFYGRRWVFNPQTDHVYISLDSLYALAQWLLPPQLGGLGPAPPAQLLTGWNQIQSLVIPHRNPTVDIAGMRTNLQLAALLATLPAGAVTGYTPQNDPQLALVNGRDAGVHAAIANLNGAILGLGDMTNDFEFAEAYVFEWQGRFAHIDGFFATT